MGKSAPAQASANTDLEMLSGIQAESFEYFLHQICEKTGLVKDSSQPGSPASISATGMALACYVVAAEKGLISREDAMKRVLRILRFFHHSVQSDAPDATGFKGFYYHFLEVGTGKRTWGSELSTIDTALLISGMLVASEYFSREHSGEREVQKLAHELYSRVDWQWALNGQKTLSHGWKPEDGFLESRWNSGYNEAQILYILAMGSPTHAIDGEGYREWTKTFQIKEYYGNRYIYAGPLFIHQMSQIWLHLEGIVDDFTAEHGFDYFENSRRATCAQRSYAIENPKKLERYGEFCWGITATDGPGPAVYKVHGIERTFYNYIARGAPDDIDDGTISPWVVVTSLPFTPEIVVDTVRHAIEQYHLNQGRLKGFTASFNPTFPEHEPGHMAWMSKWQFGINQGPMILMIENHLSGLIWKLMMNNTFIKSGLKHAGFRSVQP